MLTGTIDCVSFNCDTTKPKINVVLINTLDRLSQYENAISRYIKESYFTDIVFVENSGYPFPKEKYENLAKEHGKRFEFLYRKLSNEEVSIMQERGKSWGEADLIDYAMVNSVLISQSETVYKVTGRVFLRNSKQILKRAHKESEFKRWYKYDWVETVFFKINKRDYFSCLFNAKEKVNDHSNSGDWVQDLYIERVYFLNIVNSNIIVKPFRVCPELEGVVASRGNRQYEKKLVKRLLYNLSVLIPIIKNRWKIK